MSKLLVAAALVLVAGAVSSCAKRNSVPTNDPHALVAGGAKLVDVRTPGEFASEHLPGAINIPVQQLSARLSSLGDKDEPIVVYCRSGARSARAAKILIQAGYSTVHDLGSLNNW